MSEIFYQDELVILFYGDNNDFVADKTMAFITDPPYGINKKWKRKWHGNNGASRLWDGKIPIWDESTPVESVLKWKDTASESIIWGGNFYPLESSRCWFIWDKLQPNRGAECELAWTNLECPPRVFRMSRIDAYFNKTIFKKEHPNEKPIQLMEWCLEKINKKLIVFDPFAGCGSTLIAAKRMGRKSIGVEKDRSYCEVIKKRLESIKIEGYDPHPAIKGEVSVG
jgi:site-specific DNA-methyltransferase (adenine-specific)